MGRVQVEKKHEIWAAAKLEAQQVKWRDRTDITLREQQTYQQKIELQNRRRYLRSEKKESNWPSQSKK